MGVSLINCQLMYETFSLIGFVLIAKVGHFYHALRALVGAMVDRSVVASTSEDAVWKREKEKVGGRQADSTGGP